MSIDFSKVNISLDQFQDISIGKYNAGDVKLSSESSLTKVNNHVHMTGLNKVPIPHDEVLAIKNAFITALSGSGVGAAEIAKVRQELGLAPDGAADRTLAQRSVKPLSRQQIRDILDRNARTINTATQRTAIRTTGQLQDDLDYTEKTRRSDVRKATNAATDARREPQEDPNVRLFQSLLGGNTRFRTAADQNALLALAQTQRDSLLAATGGNPSVTDPCILTFETESGAKIKMDAGCTQAQFLAKLDETIRRLSTLPAASARTLAVFDEFNSLPNDKARKEWFRNLPDDADRGFKLRTATIAVFLERGVDDHATLSAVNHTSDRYVRTLLDTLLTTAANMKGDTLRDFQLVRMVTLQANAQPEVPEEQRAYIPALPPEP